MRGPAEKHIQTITKEGVRRSRGRKHAEFDRPAALTMMRDDDDVDDGFTSDHGSSW